MAFAAPGGSAVRVRLHLSAMMEVIIKLRINPPPQSPRHSMKKVQAYIIYLDISFFEVVDMLYVS